MTQAYVYKWTHLPTLQWYIGCRYANGCHPNDGYICSSKIVKPLIQSNLQDWHRQIIAIGSKIDMLELENEILNLLDAAKDERSFNKNNGGGKFSGQQGPLTITHYKNICKAAQKRSKDPKWHEANTKRLLDPNYIKRLSSSIKSFYENNPNAQQEKINSEKWRQNHRAGVKKNLERPDYVHPRGMLGKTRSEESRKKASESSKGHVKPLEGNKKISAWRKGRKPKKESIEKMRKALIGRESGRSRKVQTPAGIFNKLKDAAIYYQVPPESIKNYINGKNVKEWFKPHLESKGVLFDNLKPIGFAWAGDFENELKAKAIQTPDGIFQNMNEAAAFYGITSNAIRYRIISQSDKYKKI